MSARIKHVAIQSKDKPILTRFYRQLFGLKAFAGAGEEGGAMSDGYVGLNINQRAAGRQGGFDHFGFEVDDVERVFALGKEKGVEYLKRPSTRPFASFSMHDPLGNIFDVTQRGLANRRDVYADNAAIPRTPRHITHFQLRTVDPQRLIEFYRDVFDLEGEGYHLTDGVVTLIVAPWKIADYADTGIERPALDHLGFRVESLETFQEDLRRMVEADSSLEPKETTGNPEREARLKLLQTCGYGEQYLADPDGVLIEVSQA